MWFTNTYASLESTLDKMPAKWLTLRDMIHMPKNLHI